MIWRTVFVLIVFFFVFISSQQHLKFYQAIHSPLQSLAEESIQGFQRSDPDESRERGGRSVQHLHIHYVLILQAHLSWGSYIGNTNPRIVPNCPFFFQLLVSSSTGVISTRTLIYSHTDVIVGLRHYIDKRTLHMEALLSNLESMHPTSVLNVLKAPT